MGFDKTILKEGTGASPQKGRSVTVHCTGFGKNGNMSEKFWSTKDAGQQPFTFKIGLGQVIKGWDEGVATMKRGERAKFTIQAHKAYGKRGSPPKIPGDATLVFDVELLSWSEPGWESVGDGDDSVLKRQKQSGEGYKKPHDFASVTVHYKLMLDNESRTLLKDTLSEGASVSFALDDGTAWPFLEAAVKSMLKGEAAEFRVGAASGFGVEGNAALGVPASADLFLEVHLVDFQNDKDSWDLSVQDKLTALDAAKEKGNAFFKKSDFARAQRRYEFALKYVQETSQWKDEEKSEAKKRKAVVNGNIAQCLLNMKQYRKAEEAASKVLEDDADNVKGLFRRANALIEIGEWERADRDLNRCLVIEPANAGALEARKRLKTLEQAQLKKDKALYAKMFA